MNCDFIKSLVRKFGLYAAIAVAVSLCTAGTAQVLTVASQRSPPAPAQGDTTAKNVQTLVVGSEQDYPPFAIGMTDATAGGFTVDLWKAVATEAGLNCTIHVRPFHQLIQDFKAGKIDVLINLAISDERRRFADFSVPHVIVHGAMFVRKGQAGIHSEGDLAGKSIIVLNADLAHDYAVSKGWGKQLVLVDTAAQGMGLLASGKHDAMLLSRIVGLQTLNALELTSVEALPAKVGFSQKFAFATQHEQTELLAKLNEGLAVTKANGAYSALYEEWFGVYEVREAGLRDLLRYIVPIIAFFLACVGYLLYQRQLDRNRAHVAMAESRELLRTIIDSAPVRVFWKDQNLSYLGCNALFAKDAGMTNSQDLIGKDDFQMGWANQAEMYRADDRAVIASGVAKLFFEEPQTAPDGRMIWLRTSKVPIKDKDGITTGVLGIYDDITEQKLTGEKLRQLSIIVEQSPTSVVITDLEARIQYVNPRFTTVTGYSAAEVLGQNPRILKSNMTPQGVYEELWRKLSGGQAWHGVLINRRKNGQPYWEESQIAPVKDEQGVITHYVAVKTDVTERVRSNEKLDALLREQNAILQNKLVGIVTVRDRIIIWANAAFAQMLGYTPGELAGASTRKSFPSNEAYLAFGDIAYPALSSGSLFRSQIEFVRKDGASIWVDVSGSMLDPLAGVYLWCFIDITENRRLEEEIRALAFHDPMTRLANRRMLDDRLEQAMAGSKRSSRYGAVLALDLDNFKPLNDLHGHLVGDLLLIEVAKRLTACVRQVDTVARVGGDEFVIVLAELDIDETQAKSLAKVIAEKIRIALDGPYLLTAKKEGQADYMVEHHCSASIGVAMFINYETPQKEVLSMADTAMYQAKKSGRNAVRFHEPGEFA